VTGATRLITKTWAWVLFILFYAKELVISNLKVAQLVLLSARPPNSSILEVPLDLKTDFAIALYMNLITFTPGTLSMDRSADGRSIYVHFLDVRDPESEVQTLKAQLEARLKFLLEQ
jgi:multisubunit Na+/H+ antiporter MnhE subunit